MAQDFDEHLADFRTRPLNEAGPYGSVAADALSMKVREGGRVQNVSVMVDTGVNNDGQSEILGVQVATGEAHAGWLASSRDLMARVLCGVALVTSDAHAGLVEAIAATFRAVGRTSAKLGAQAHGACALTRRLADEPVSVCGRRPPDGVRR